MRILQFPWPLLISALIAGEVQVAIAGSDEIARGRRDFMDLCADCHGEDAAGSGPLTINLTKIPPDLTRIKLRAHGKFDDKAILDWIIGLNMPDSHGSREMPIWGDWLMDEMLEDSTSLDAGRAAEKAVKQRVMAIVAYLKSIQVDK